MIKIIAYATNLLSSKFLKIRNAMEKLAKIAIIPINWA